MPFDLIILTLSLKLIITMKNNNFYNNIYTINRPYSFINQLPKLNIFKPKLKIVEDELSLDLIKNLNINSYLYTISKDKKILK